MGNSYCEQVLEAADENGLLSQRDANRLMFDHGTALYRLEREGYKGHHRDAQALLHHLGY